MLYRQQSNKLPNVSKLKSTLTIMHANTVSIRNLLQITLTDETTIIRSDLKKELHNSITFLDDLALTLNRLKKTV